MNNFYNNFTTLTFSLTLSCCCLVGCDSISTVSTEEHIQRAKDFDSKGDFKGAIIELKNAAQQAPENPQVRLLLGGVYLRFKQGEEAAKELSYAKKLGVSGESVMPLLGEALILNKDYQRVLDDIQPVDSISKRNKARILQIRGDALLGLGKLKDGCALYNESNHIDTEWHKAQLGLSKCAFAQRDIVAAQTYLQQAIKLAPDDADSWIMLADLERRKGTLAAAKSAYDNALKANKISADALAGRASILIAMNDAKSAKQDISQLLRTYPKHFLGEYLEALILYRENKANEAQDKLNSVLRNAPNYLPAVLLAGVIAFEQGNFQTAETHSKKVLKYIPRDVYALRLLAATQLKQGHADDAAKTLEVLLPESSNNANVRKLAGEIALKQKKYPAAEAHFAKAAELSPENAVILAELGLSRIALGDPNALDSLQEAALIDKSGHVDIALILNLLQQRKYDAALINIATLEKEMPGSPIPWNYRGGAYLGKKDFQKARESFTQALKLDPGFHSALNNLAQIDLREGKIDAARQRYESILSQDKTNTKAILSLAEIAQKTGKSKDYLVYLEEAHNVAPNSIQPLALLVNYYLDKGSFERALDYARQALDANPNNPNAIALLASVQLTSGDRISALSTYKKLVSVSPNFPGAYLSLAIAQLSNKEQSQARTSIEKALQLNPAYIPALDTLLKLEIQENKPQAALSIARRLQSQYPKSALGFEREGDILVALKRFTEAGSFYGQALARGGNSDVFIKQNRALIWSGDHKTAEQKFAARLKSNPKDNAVRSYVATYYLLMGRNRDAIAQYEHLNRVSPNNVIYLNNLALLYQRQKDPRAIATADKALKLAPNQPGVLDTMGWLLIENGHLNRGLELLRKASIMVPQAASTQFHYAVGLARSGDHPQAKKVLQRTLSSNPSFPESMEARRLLATLTN